MLIGYCQFSENVYPLRAKVCCVTHAHGRGEKSWDEANKLSAARKVEKRTFHSRATSTRIYVRKRSFEFGARLSLAGTYLFLTRLCFRTAVIITAKIHHNISLFIIFLTYLLIEQKLCILQTFLQNSFYQSSSEFTVFHSYRND